MKRLTAMTMIAVFAATTAFAEGCEPEKTYSPGPADAASGATSADLCSVPTSVAPSPDATTWPCKNFSKS